MQMTSPAMRRDAREAPLELHRRARQESAAVAQLPSAIWRLWGLDGPQACSAGDIARVDLPRLSLADPNPRPRHVIQSSRWTDRRVVVAVASHLSLVLRSDLRVDLAGLISCSAQ